MPHFELRFHVPPRGERRLRVQAEDADAAVAAALAPAGLSPLHLLGVTSVAAPAVARSRGFVLRLFTQELALLLDAGIPLLEALTTLHEKGGRGGQAGVLEKTVDALRCGQPLSVALAAQPQAFDPLFVAIVAASERSGQLPTALRHHTAYLAWSDALRARLMAAALYPALLLAVGAAVVLFLLLYVLPRFAGVFDGLGRPLPAASQALIDLGVWGAAHPQAVAALLVGLLTAALAIAGIPALRAAARRHGLALLLRLPGLGAHLRTVLLARLYRALGLLIGAGVPVPAALGLADGLLPEPQRSALRAATAQVNAGVRLSQALHEQALATPVALRMLRVGESSGNLATMLERAAAFHDEEIARSADLATRIVNPLLMLTMGVVIGGIVVLMYLPIFTLMEQVQ